MVPVVVCLRNLDSAQSEAQAPESYHQPKSVALKVLDWKAPIERRKEGFKSIKYLCTTEESGAVMQLGRDPKEIADELPRKPSVSECCCMSSLGKLLLKSLGSHLTR